MADAVRAGDHGKGNAMSLTLSASLQAAVFDALSGDAALAALAGGVFDAEPEGAPDLYVALGDETVRDLSDVTGPGAAHLFRVGVVTTREGFAGAKRAAARVVAVLGGGLALPEGRLVSLTFRGARARRSRRDGTRRVDLTFRARTEL